MRRMPKIRPEVQAALDRADISHLRSSDWLRAKRAERLAKPEIMSYAGFDQGTPELTLVSKMGLWLMLALVIAFVVIAIVSAV